MLVYACLYYKSIHLLIKDNISKNNSLHSLFEHFTVFCISICMTVNQVLHKEIYFSSKALWSKCIFQIVNVTYRIENRIEALY